MKRPVRILAMAAAVAASLWACSFGIYDDDGSASPGQWWPWVCPDAADVAAPDAGCEPPKCPDGSADGAC